MPIFFKSFKDEKVAGFGETIAEYFLKKRGINKKEYIEDDYLQKKFYDYKKEARETLGIMFKNFYLNLN
jgi:hypothetical protein